MEWSIPLTLLNLKEKTLSFRFKITHVPGRKYNAPDATSRYPTGPKQTSKLYLQGDSYEHADALTTLNIRDEATGHSLDEALMQAAVSILDEFEAIT